MLKRLFEGSLMPCSRAHVYWNGTFSDAGKSALLHAPLPRALERTLADLSGRLLAEDPLAAYQWFDQKCFLPDDILQKVDRMSMAHALEVRPPFLDHRIVEFTASLPASFKIQGSRQKVLLKELMKDKLPASVLRARKIGLDIPVHEWLRGALRTLLLDSLATGVAEYGELFKRKEIEVCVLQHMERRANLGYQLWGLLILFLWMKKWRIQAAPNVTSDPHLTENVLTSV